MSTVCIVGYGYWGPKLVRNFLAQGVEAMVCDNRSLARDRARKDFPACQVCSDYDSALTDPGVLAVAIATPVATHYPLAHAALMAGKHVLVEKPFTYQPEEAEMLVKLAHDKDLALMVDHTFLYHPSISFIKSLIDTGELGNLDYIDSTRINLGLFQPDVDVIWDLAVHDVAIALYLTLERPISVQAVAASHRSSKHANIGSLFLRYTSGLFVHVNVSWVSPVKIRSMIVGGDRRMVVYDDLNVSEPVKIYDTRVAFDRASAVEYRIGDVRSPKIIVREALGDLVFDFMQHIKGESDCRSDGQFGLDVVRVLHAARKSMAAGGTEVKL